MSDCFCGYLRDRRDRNTNRARVQFSGWVHYYVSKFLEKVLAKAQISGVTAMQLKRMGECLYIRFSQSPDSSMQEFLLICNEHRTGVSEDEWDRFVDAFVSEFFQVTVKEEHRSQTMMRIATCFANSIHKDDDSNRSSVCAVMDLPFGDNTVVAPVECNVDCEKEWCSCSDVVEGSCLGIPFDDEIGCCEEEASVITYIQSELLEDQSYCNVTPTSICLVNCFIDDGYSDTSVCGFGICDIDLRSSNQANSTSAIRLTMVDLPVSSKVQNSSSVLSNDRFILTRIFDKELD